MEALGAGPIFNSVGTGSVGTNGLINPLTSSVGNNHYVSGAFGGRAENFRWDIPVVNTAKGTFTLTLRQGNDTNVRKQIIENHANLSFDPESSDFILNKDPFTNSKILIAGKNFGCGSSREHAPWALLDFGITCVISSSFADIFYSNCFKNGILPIIVDEEKIKELSEYANRKEEISVDLKEEKIVYGNNEIKFKIDSFKKKCLLEGLDDIALSLNKSDKIKSFEQKLKSSKPWIISD